jgi:hypothetical protein
MKQKATVMLESRNLKMSLLQSIIDITEEDCLNGFKTMKMLSLSLFYLERRYGTMMVARKAGMFRMARILAWWIQCLKSFN